MFEITGSGFVTGPVTPPIVSADILWQNTDGQASVWEMTGNTLVGGGPVSPNPGPSWTEIETGDFNHDGHSDILWQNANGQASIWDMNGNSLIGGGPVTPNPGPAWHAIGAGDFTDDGFSDDILWRNTSSGQVSIWEMSGNTLIGGGPVSPNPGPAWKAIGAGDFNKDERAARLVYYAFDLLHLEGRDVSSLRLTDRKALLEPLVANKSGLQYNGHEIGDGELILSTPASSAFEGVVSKTIDAPYAPGNRGLWRKVKWLNRQEFVVGWSDPEGSRPHSGRCCLATTPTTAAHLCRPCGHGMPVKVLADLRRRLDPLDVMFADQRRWPALSCR